MSRRIALSVFLLFIFSVICHSQEKRRSFVTIKGMVKDHESRAVKNAQIFIDMVKTDVASNKKGKYKVKFGPKNELITVYHPKHGFINWQYDGERKIDFLYPKETDAISQEKMEELGFDFKVRKIKNHYASFNSVTDILISRFSNVKIDGNGTLIIGRMGPHTVTSDSRPLLLVNEMPTDISQLDFISTQEIKSIQVLHKPDQTGPYGLRGANGVIIIKLKNGEESLKS